MILLDDMDVDVVKFVYVSGFESKSATLGVTEDAGREGLMGGT